jgi:osmotically inducible protein OsmC
MRLSGILSPLPLISAKETNNHMKRTAQAHWQGDLKSGKGSLTSPSQVLNNTAYSFHTRFENEHGTNPEELLAAAHAGCFTMALSAQLANAGLTADSLDTTCTISLEKTEGGFSITGSHLDLKAKIPGATKEAFDTAVQAAETGCPVSKLYKTAITVNAVLES